MDVLSEYFICEMACKELIVGYKDSQNEPMAYEDVKMNVNTIKSALRHYGIVVPESRTNYLFSSDPSSVKKLRDRLVHGISKDTIRKLNNQYEQMMIDMRLFLSSVEN